MEILICVSCAEIITSPQEGWHALGTVGLGMPPESWNLHVTLQWTMEAQPYPLHIWAPSTRVVKCLPRSQQLGLPTAKLGAISLDSAGCLFPHCAGASWGQKVTVGQVPWLPAPWHLLSLGLQYSRAPLKRVSQAAEGSRGSLGWDILLRSSRGSGRQGWCTNSDTEGRQAGQGASPRNTLVIRNFGCFGWAGPWTMSQEQGHGSELLPNSCLLSIVES